MVGSPSSGALPVLAPPARRRVRAAAPWLGFATVVGAAVAWLAALGTMPGYDAWGWLVWGREASHGALDLHGAPSWKPLTFAFTTLLAPAGGAAPALWLVIACAGALAAAVLAGRLAARFAGVVAGVAAALALALVTSFVHDASTGGSDPLTVALVLGAIERQLDERPRQALALMTLAALGRPEAAPFAIAFAAWVWHREPRDRVLATAAVLAVPALWIVPPWLSTGAPLAASDLAQHYPSGLHGSPVVGIPRRTLDLVRVPVALGALLGLVAALRWRSRGLLAIAAGAGTWVAVVTAMTLHGYPGLQRFLDEPAAIVAVLAGVGAGWLAGRPPPWRSARAVAACVVVAAAVSPFVAGRARSIAADLRHEQARAGTLRALTEAVERAGGNRRVLACGQPTARLEFQSALAWRLGVDVGRVGYHPERDVRRLPVVLFTRVPGPVRTGRVLAAAPPWTVVAIGPRTIPRPCPSSTSRSTTAASSRACCRIGAAARY